MENSDEKYKGNKNNSSLSDKLSGDMKDQLKDIASKLEKSEVKNESEEEPYSGFDKEKFLERMGKNKDKDGPPYFTLQSTPEQGVEDRLNKKIREIKHRLDVVENYLERLDKYFHDKKE